jgi:hypothetical protein
MHKCVSPGCVLPGVIKLEVEGPPDWTKEHKWCCVEHVTTEEKRAEELQGWSKWVEVVPVVGMGATAGYGSDSYPYTIIAVSANGKTITVQADDHHPAPGCDHFTNQVYTYTPNPNGSTKVYTLRSNGRWVLKGDTMKGGQAIGIGARRYYQDPSF